MKVKDIPKYEKGLVGVEEGGNKQSAEVTELRIWNVALNENILSETYRFPLAMLAEQKRKVKVKINKQQKDQSKPKGLGLNKKLFATNIAKSKLAAVAPGPSTQRVPEANNQSRNDGGAPGMNKEMFQTMKQQPARHSIGMSELKPPPESELEEQANQIQDGFDDFAIASSASRGLSKKDSTVITD